MKYPGKDGILHKFTGFMGKQFEILYICYHVKKYVGAFVYRNGPNYRNGLPEWTLICGFEYFLCTLLGQSGLELPQKVIKPRNMQFMYQKMDSAQWKATYSHVTAWVTVAVP